MILFYNQEANQVPMSGLLSLNFNNQVHYGPFPENEIPRLVVSSELSDLRRALEQCPQSTHVLYTDAADQVPDYDTVLDLAQQGLRYVASSADLMEKIAKSLEAAPMVAQRLALAPVPVLDGAKLQVSGLENNHLIGQSQECLRVLTQTARYVADIREEFSTKAPASLRSDADMLILGEHGTGKTNLVRVISENIRMDLSVIDMGALNANTATSSLFGHKKGAFTGADSEHTGIFGNNKNGIIFLDEIGNLPLETQEKLLKFLETRTFYRMGEEGDAKRMQEFSGILVFATNANLEEKVRQGTFRADFFDRINKNTVVMKPLWEHPEDIPLLASHVLEQVNSNRKPAKQKQFAPDTLEFLGKLPWKGNIRELVTTVKMLASQESSPVITLETLLAVKMGKTYESKPNPINEQAVLDQLKAKVQQPGARGLQQEVQVILEKFKARGTGLEATGNGELESELAVQQLKRA